MWRSTENATVAAVVTRMNHTRRCMYIAYQWDKSCQRTAINA